MSRRVFVTGAAGFAGHHFVEHILEKTDWTLVCPISLRHRGDTMRLQELKKVEYGDRVKYIYHDLNGPISDRMIKKIGTIDYIVNYASESHVDRSIEEPVPFIQNNVNLILNVLEYSRKIKPKLFIQISTDEVYGPAIEPECHKEWSPILPSNPYSASKAAQESICISYWRTYGVPLILTNTMNMFGERQDIEKFVPKIISHVLNEKTVPIHGNEQYIGKRFYLHARNLADAVLFLLDRGTHTAYTDTLATLVIPERYNVVGEVELNNLELAQIIADIVGKPLKYELIDFHSARPGHDRRYALDGSLIHSIGWKQPIPFKASIERTVKWTMERLGEGWTE